LLRAFDDQVGLRILHLEERLTRRMVADLQMLIYLAGSNFVASNFLVDELSKVSLGLAPEEVTEEEGILRGME
jgi:hypothetical protein